MHELSVALELYSGLRAEIEGRGGGRLSSVKIVVGELAGVEPALLQFAWEAVAADGTDAGALLEIEWRRVTQRCPSCGDIEEAVPGSWLRPCPICGAPLQLAGGRELDIVSFAYDEASHSRTSNARAADPMECKT